MCPNDTPEEQQPLGPQLFDEVCGATPSGSTGQLQATSYTNFGEWTPTETWVDRYTELLQGQRANPVHQATGPGRVPSTSHSSQASGPDASAPESSRTGSGGASGSAKGGWFGRAKEKVKRWKNRTPLQSEANKAAQKRYRERKKGQVTELQAQAEQLATQVKSLQVVQEENVRLEASNSALEQQLSASSLNTSAESKQQTDSSGRSQWQTFNDQFLRVVEELGAFLRERGVQPSATNEGTPPETIAEINARLLAAMQTCMQALNLGGLKLQSLIDAVETRKALASHAGQEGQRGSYQAAQKLGLTPEQIRRGLQYRTHALAVLEKIYAAREGLDARVAAMLQAPDAPSTQVAAALTDLKENLSAEMRAVSEQHFLLLRMLLSPTQGAWLLVESFPMHCDCLAFFNGLHAAYGGASPKLGVWN